MDAKFDRLTAKVQRLKASQTKIMKIQRELHAFIEQMLAVEEQDEEEG